MYVGKPFIEFHVRWSGYPVPNITLQIPSSLQFQGKVFYHSNIKRTGMYYLGETRMRLLGINTSDYSGNYSVVAGNGFVNKSVLVGIVNVESKFQVNLQKTI